MATRPNRNAEGKYYVTEECDGCGICASFAGETFLSTNDGSRYYVVHQPLDDQEDQAVLDAMEECPLGCIRDDGDRDAEDRD
jgi:ferredoxin